MILYVLVFALVLLLGYFVNADYRRDINLCTSQLNRSSRVTRQGYVNRVMLTGIFFILFMVSALRVGTGNDYWVYRTGFLQINGGETPVSYELGFKAVVLLMQKIFYRDCYKEIFALFALLTALFFVKGLYDTADWFVASLFIFMANGFYYMSFSNVRYYFAFALCMCSLRPLLDKKYGKFIIYILAAALFHKTALLCLLAYPIALFLKWTKKTIWLIPVGCAFLVSGKAIIRWLLFKIYIYYEGDPLDNGNVSYINILKCGAILVFALINYRECIKGDKKAEMLFNLNLFSFMLYAFASYIPELSRVCYYMVMGQVFLIPLVLKKIENKKKKLFFEIVIFLAFLLYFAMFLKKGSNPGVNILPYLSWIFG